MAFSLPNQEPQRGGYPAGSLQALLDNAIGAHLSTAHASGDPRATEFFSVLESLDFTNLDQSTMDDIVSAGELALMIETRDAHFQAHRVRLQTANRITVLDKDSPTGLSTYAIGSEEREKFIELLERVAQTPIEAIQPEPILPVHEIVEEALVKAVREDAIACNRMLRIHIRDSTVHDPLNNKWIVLGYSSTQRLPSELNTALRRLAKITAVLQSCIDQPYAFAIENGIKRDDNLAQEVKAGLDEILYEANAKLLEKINEFKRATKRAAKSGTAVVSQALDIESGNISEIDQPEEKIDAAMERATTEVIPDHTMEVLEHGMHTVLSPLNGVGQHQAEVHELRFGKNVVLVVYAYDPSLQTTSEQSRAKYDRASGKVHSYDIAIRTVAEQLANNESVENLVSKTLKYVNGSKRSKPYADMTVAGKKVRSANDSNIYFTFSTTKELHLDIPDIADSQCIVVLAETDKANQLAVLQRINGTRAARLKSKRAGIK